MLKTASEVREFADKGIRLCQQGQLEEGYKLLRLVARQESTSELPGRYYSYLGVCLAGFEGKYNEGLKLCQKAIDVEFFQAENYANLAETYLMLGSRKPALRAIRDGLRVDRRHPKLLELRQEFGVRKRPILPFLSRDHGVNQMLGRMRHSLKSTPPRSQEAAE